MIEAAQTAAGDVPADEFLEALEKRKQWELLADVALTFEQLARFGYLDNPWQFEEIEAELIMIKANKVRLPCYRASHYVELDGIRITSGYLAHRGVSHAKHLKRAKAIRDEDRRL